MCALAVELCAYCSVVSHVEQVLAIELLAACQALDFHRPRTTTAPLEDVYKLVRTIVKWVIPYCGHAQINVFSYRYCRPWKRDRFMAPDIEAATKLLREGKVSLTFCSLSSVPSCSSALPPPPPPPPPHTYLHTQVWAAVEPHIQHYQSTAGEPPPKIFKVA